MGTCFEWGILNMAGGQGRDRQTGAQGKHIFTISTTNATLILNLNSSSLISHYSLGRRQDRQAGRAGWRLEEGQEEAGQAGKLSAQRKIYA